MGAWGISYWGGEPRRGGACFKLPLPISSDAEEYVVLIDGRIEQWDYTPWDRQWYFYSAGVDLLIPAALCGGVAVFLILPRGRKAAMAI